VAKLPDLTVHKNFLTISLVLFCKTKYRRDIEILPLSLVLQTPTRVLGITVLITKGGVRGDGEVKSMQRICKSSYGGKMFSFIFTSIYEN
jgi:hypothetical protein